MPQIIIDSSGEIIRAHPYVSIFSPRLPCRICTKINGNGKQDSSISVLVPPLRGFLRKALLAVMEFTRSWWHFLSNFFLGICSCSMFLTLCVPQTLATVNMEVGLEVEEKPTLQYCSFFANRAPNIQLGLKNCTWFKGNSCCRQEEIDAIFPRVKPLRGSSPACQRFTNYLMCYVCAPNQNRFYMMESLTVCEEFCDAWYEACHAAILKGSVIKQLYSNGSEYCRSRRFKVEPADEGNCFFFDAKQDKSDGVSLTLASSQQTVIIAIGFAALGQILVEVFSHIRLFS